MITDNSTTKVSNRCLGGCKHYSSDLELAHLAHYRKGCSGGVKNCSSYRENWVKDDRAMHFAQPLMDRTKKALVGIGMLAKEEERGGGRKL